MMRVSKQRLFNFEEFFTIASLSSVVLCVGARLGKTPLIPVKPVFGVF